MTTLNPILRISFTVWLMLFATHSAIAQMESEMIVTRMAPAIVSVSVIPLAPGAVATEPLSAQLFPQIIRGEGQSLASGIVISPDGWIVTINSAMDNKSIRKAPESPDVSSPLGTVSQALSATILPQKIMVYTHTGMGYQARLVGRDARSEIALLKIDAPVTLPYVQLPATSGNPPMALGERVLALGRPGWSSQLSLVVTDGIVSNFESANSNGTPSIYSTAGIQNGMGGGPLVRVKTGEVVGFNTHIWNLAQAAPLTVSLPVAEFNLIVQDLRTHGRVRRAAIGISATTVAVDNLKGQGVERFYSARVTAVRAGGPAQLAQVEVGDFILNVNGVPTPTAGTLLRFISERKPDENLDLAVIRKGARLTIKVRTEELTP
jgi:serine protease Do